MIVFLIRLLGILACSYGGYRIAALVNANYILRDPQRVLAIATGIVVGALLGYVLGGPAGRAAARVLGRMEASASRITAADFFFGAAGMLFGVLVAILPSVALFRLGNVGYVLAVILFFACALIGMRLAVDKRSELSSMLKLGPGFGAQGGGGAVQILDTSVIIDGRIVDIAKCGFLPGTMLVPRFILNELQSVADSADTLRRNRGRRGLEVLNALQRLPNVTVEINDQDFSEISEVDGKLVALSELTGYPLTTNDYNLNRVAEIQGVKVLNINELAGALKPVVLPGEEMKVKVIREGKEAGQGVGYLDDGTMVVIEQGKKRIGAEVPVIATSVLQTPAGKMVFAELADKGQGN